MAAVARLIIVRNNVIGFLLNISLRTFAVYDRALDRVVYHGGFYYGQTQVRIASLIQSALTSIICTVYANSFVACLNARAMLPGQQMSQFETAMFSSVPDISVMSTNGSILPTSYTPTPRNGTNRTVSVSARRDVCLP